MSPEDKLKSLGIELPLAPDPLGSYVPCVRTGNLLFLSGMLPIKDGTLLYAGRTGEDVSLEEARQGSRQAVINALAVVRAELGDLTKISRCVKVTGYVASAPDFIEQPKVLNAASDLLFEVFGDRGKHARAAVGVYVLPLNAPVELDFVFELV
jgi:enamine deaminase RidA (YjgF/YER057c/UK114 family)